MNKRLFKFSVIDFLLLLTFSIILFVALTGFLSLIMGKTFFSFFGNQWITFVIYVLILPITQASINRRGELIIADSEYLSKCNNHLDEIILSKGYISNRKSDNETIYTRRTKIGRFFNCFFNENIQVRNEEGVIRIFPVFLNIKINEREKNNDKRNWFEECNYNRIISYIVYLYF